MQDRHYQRARWLSYLTVAYNVCEGFLSLAAGYLAGSAALVGFGLGSFIESLSGAVLIWRFRARETLAPAEEERREKRAVRLVGYTFFLVAAYVAYESLEKLYLKEAPAPSLFRIVIAAAALVAMPALFLAKRRTGGAPWEAGASWQTPGRPWPAPSFPWPCSSAWASITSLASGRPIL